MSKITQLETGNRKSYFFVKQTKEQKQKRAFIEVCYCVIPGLSALVPMS